MHANHRRERGLSLAITGTTAILAHVEVSAVSLAGRRETS